MLDDNSHDKEKSKMVKKKKVEQSKDHTQEKTHRPRSRKW